MRTLAQKQNQLEKQVSPSLARSNTAALGLYDRADTILHLQGTIGNQAVQRLIRQAEPADLTARSSTKEATPLAPNFSQIPAHPESPSTIQAKLDVSAPGDIYEQEADRVSDQMMHMPEPQLKSACA